MASVSQPSMQVRRSWSLVAIKCHFFFFFFFLIEWHYKMAEMIMSSSRHHFNHPISFQYLRYPLMLLPETASTPRSSRPLSCCLRPEPPLYTPYG
ncbi:hypothetical protein BDW72DRAFT_180398 [Aspergillus terricola var. indicus]